MPWPWIYTSGPADFTLLTGEVVIPSTTVQGQGICVAAIDILGDTIVEGNETFQLMIQPTNSLDMVSSGGNTTTVTIVDNDGKHQPYTTTVQQTWVNGNELSIYYPTGATVYLNETDIVVQEGDDSNTTVDICIFVANDTGSRQRDIVLYLTVTPDNASGKSTY